VGWEDECTGVLTAVSACSSFSASKQATPSSPIITHHHPNIPATIPPLQLDNVLLKSDASRRLGFTPKLGDFGQARILNDSCAPVSISGAGAAAHLAPETFQAGSRATAAVDSYAFGAFGTVVLWGAMLVLVRRRECIPGPLLGKSLLLLFADNCTPPPPTCPLESYRHPDV